MSKEQRNKNLRILFSVAVAIALWVFVAFGEGTDITVWERNVEVDMVGSESLREQGLVVVMATTPTVDVRLSGSRQSLYRKDDGDVSAKVDLSNIHSAGTYTLPVSSEVSIRGTGVTETSPAKINITVEKLVTETKEVAVETEGKCATDFSVSEVNCEPVEITGPESIVKSLSAVADPVSVEGAESDVKVRSAVHLTNGNGKVVTRRDTELSTRMVEVVCSVQYEKTVPIRVELDDNGEEGYTYESSVNPKEIMLFGDKTLLAGISEAVTVPVDVSGITSETTRTVRLKLPENVSVVKESKIEVTLYPVRATDTPSDEPSVSQSKTDEP